LQELWLVERIERWLLEVADAAEFEEDSWIRAPRHPIKCLWIEYRQAWEWIEGR